MWTIATYDRKTEKLVTFGMSNQSRGFRPYASRKDALADCMKANTKSDWLFYVPSKVAR